MKRIGVLTSGGDAPGMNAAIRAIVRTALYHGIEVYGIYRGFDGLIDGEILLMSSKDVSNIIHRGGTILKTSRSKRFLEKEWREKAYQNLKELFIEGLIVIGGDGSYKGTHQFISEHTDIHAVGVPGTIDNDLYGTDYTIGYDTAINIAVEAIDRIRDTASSLDRIFIVEVMGKDAGFIALRSGIAGGAEAVLIPELYNDFGKALKAYYASQKYGKSSFIIVVAEGDETGGAHKVAEMFKKAIFDVDLRVVILGHIQRGGNPTCMDRVIASQMGVAAVEALIQGETDVAIGIQCGKINKTPLSEATKHHQKVPEYLLNLLEVLTGTKY